MTFGRYIAVERKKAGLSQKDLADRIRKEDGSAISPQYLNDIERGRRNPPSEHLLAELARELGLPKDYLVFLAGQLPVDPNETAVEPDKVVEAIQAFRRSLRGE